VYAQLPGLLGGVKQAAITDAVHAKQAPQLADVLSVELPQQRRAELTHGSKGQDCVVLPNPSVERRLAR
jgi:hypothetical protein